MNTPATALPSAADSARIDGRGLAAAATAFLIWGLLPLYLKALQSVSVLQVTAHRLVWGFLLAFAWLAIRKELGNIRAALSNPRTFWRLCASAALISLNWITYIWGIAANRVVETSLGYFINPLVNVLLGVVILSERLNLAQWTAVSIAAQASAISPGLPATRHGSRWCWRSPSACMGWCENWPMSIRSPGSPARRRCCCRSIMR